MFNDETRAATTIQFRSYARVLAAILIFIIGCDRGSDAPAPPVVPTPVATTQPGTAATSPTVDAPLESILSVDGATILFPPARLRLTERPGGVSALLMTVKSTSTATTTSARDDSEDTENGIYLDLSLDIPDISQLSEAQCRLTEEEAGNDSTNGVYLAAESIEVQPHDVSITFDVRPDGLVDVKIKGRFIRPPRADGVASETLVTISGMVRAVMEKAAP